jgi:transposase-like protein
MNVGKRRRLAPSEKYEIYVAVLTGQATQREAAERFGVDRSTVVHVCRTAKQGGAGGTGRLGAGPAEAVAGGGRAGGDSCGGGALRATVTEQAVALHLHQLARSHVIMNRVDHR